jgi:hypothetical protein
MKATKDEIKLALEYTIRERLTLPEYSSFGSNNWVGLDNEINYLKRALDDQPMDPEEFIECEDSTLYYLALWLNDTSSSDYGNDRIPS